MFSVLLLAQRSQIIMTVENIAFSTDPFVRLSGDIDREQVILDVSNVEYVFDVELESG